jgi:WD40 repeat protein
MESRSIANCKLKSRWRRRQSALEPNRGFQFSICNLQFAFCNLFVIRLTIVLSICLSLPSLSPAAPVVESSKFEPQSEPLGDGKAEALVAVYSPNGEHIALGGADGVIRIHEAGSGKLVAALSGHKDAIFSLTYSKDGKRLASAGSDRLIKIWNVVDNKELHTLTGHTNWVFSVAFSPDGGTLLSGSADGGIRVWDVAAGKELAVLENHRGSVRSVVFSPDGSRFASAGADRAVRIWERIAGEWKI